MPRKITRRFFFPLSAIGAVVKVSAALLLFVPLLTIRAQSIRAQSTDEIYGTQYEEPDWVYKERGDRFRALDEQGKAIAQYRRALIKRQADAEGVTAYPEVHLALAEVYREQGLTDLALRHIQQAENQAEFLVIPDQIYTVWYVKARLYRDLGRMSEVVKIYKSIVEKDDTWDTFNNRRLTSIRENLILEFRTRKELTAKFAPAYYGLGSIKYLNGSPEAAEPYLLGAFVYGYGEKTVSYLSDCYRQVGSNRALEIIRRLAF
jgi:tetratricopeptide (TPR) repeat protein